MFAVLLAIAGAVIFTLGVFHFFGDQISYLATMIAQTLDLISDLHLYFPTWLIPFIAVAIGLSILSIVVKLI